MIVLGFIVNLECLAAGLCSKPSGAAYVHGPVSAQLPVHATERRDRLTLKLTDVEVSQASRIQTLRSKQCWPFLCYNVYTVALYTVIIAPCIIASPCFFS